MQPRILVVGSLNMDLRLSLERMPAPGETCFGRSYAYIPGGKGANQAVAAARLGGQVAFCGRRGGGQQRRNFGGGPAPGGDRHRLS